MLLKMLRRLFSQSARFSFMILDVNWLLDQAADISARDVMRFMQPVFNECAPLSVRFLQVLGMQSSIGSLAAVSTALLASDACLGPFYVEASTTCTWCLVCLIGRRLHV